MGFIAILILSLISCFMGFALEILRGNITHVENGRTPNAGAALFPTIPIVPCFYLLVTLGLNALFESAGYVVVVGYFLIASAFKAFEIKKLNIEFKRLRAKKADNNPENHIALE